MNWKLGKKKKSTFIQPSIYLSFYKFPLVRTVRMIATNVSFYKEDPTTATLFVVRTAHSFGGTRHHIWPAFFGPIWMQFGVINKVLACLLACLLVWCLATIYVFLAERMLSLSFAFQHLSINTIPWLGCHSSVASMNGWFPIQISVTISAHRHTHTHQLEISGHLQIPMWWLVFYVNISKNAAGRNVWIDPVCSWTGTFEGSQVFAQNALIWVSLLVIEKSPSIVDPLETPHFMSLRPWQTSPTRFRIGNLDKAK